MTDQTESAFIRHEGQQARMFAALSNPATYGIAEPVKRIDTHAAAVFLAGTHAYKVKKAVKFPFMDQSTLKLRQRACQAELLVNRQFTPALYLGVVPITEEDGALRLGGTGKVVDWAVHMRRFDETKTLDLVADRGELTSDMLVEVSRLILASHRTGLVGDGVVATDALSGVVEETLAELTDAPALFPKRETATLTAEMRRAFADARQLLLRRGAAGRVRRCHGDLHLRNIALMDGAPVLFDAIEFDESIATTDVLYDLAFALMDLWERRLFSSANVLFNRYLWGCAAPACELDGLAALPLFLSLRAAVLAKIAAIRFRDVDHTEATRQEAVRYFDVAATFLVPRQPVLIGIGGLSGSGKTTLSANLAAQIGRAPGAVHLRSDIERKRLFAVGETDRLPQSAYGTDVTAAVFEVLRRNAERALRAGHSVIVDAVHRTRQERALLEAVALDVGTGFVGLWLQAPMDVLVARVSERVGDASDATASVVRGQSIETGGTADWHLLDASAGPEGVAAAAMTLISSSTCQTQ